MARTPDLTTDEAALYAIAVASGITTAALNTPPGAPSEGDAYIIGPAPTGDWSAKANCVAIYDAAAWAFIPTSGVLGTSHRNLALGNKASAVSYRWTGAAWRTLAAPTTMLQFTDSFDPHPQYAMRGEGGGGGGGSVAWGDITGTLSFQADLQGELDLKAGLESNTFTGQQFIDNPTESFLGIILDGVEQGYLGSNVDGEMIYDASSTNHHVFRSDSAERLRLNEFGALNFSGTGYGTAGQVLTSAGDSAPPTWEDAAGGLTQSQVLMRGLGA